jgi:hypothetical protein
VSEHKWQIGVANGAHKSAIECLGERKLKQKVRAVFGKVDRINHAFYWRPGMKLGLAVLLTIGLGVSPLLAGAAGEAGKVDTPAALASASAAAEKPKEAVKPESPPMESEVRDLRSLVEELRKELKAQQLKVAALEERLGPTPSEPTPTPIAVPSAAVPATPISNATAALRAPVAAPAQKEDDEVSPLQLKIGSAYITPVGFMDFTGVFRSHDEGSGIGTNFAGIKYGNTFNTQLSEFRWSMQNSRIGFRVDALVAGAHVIGYMESDYLGNNPGNVAVSSNSNTLRSRLYWADVQRGWWEVLGGQTWSLITPGRSGISPLPGNLFYSQDIDVNYQAGLVWGRIPELRFVLHPTNTVALAFAADSPEQYGGGSSGGPTIVLPAGLSTIIGPASSGTTSAQLNFGGTTLNAPNIAPDFITKLAYDPSSRLHVEVGGLVREFKVWNSNPPSSGTSFTKTGAGGFVNLGAEVFKGFRILTNNYWASGGGRYIFGQVPDVIIRSDGSISPIKAASTVSGFEFTHKNSLLYFYYGGIYAYQNVALDTNNTTFIGYGVPGSTSQNRLIQEGTLGFNRTVWRDGKYGAINLMGQYSYVSRNPWATLAPSDAHLNMAFLNLRYTLPGSAPTLGK